MSSLTVNKSDHFSKMLNCMVNNRNTIEKTGQYTQEFTSKRLEVYGGSLTKVENDEALSKARVIFKKCIEIKKTLTALHKKNTALDEYIADRIQIIPDKQKEIIKRITTLLNAVRRNYNSIKNEFKLYKNILFIRIKGLEQIQLCLNPQEASQIRVLYLPQKIKLVGSLFFEKDENQQKKASLLKLLKVSLANFNKHKKLPDHLKTLTPMPPLEKVPLTSFNFSSELITPSAKKIQTRTFSFIPEPQVKQEKTPFAESMKLSAKHCKSLLPLIGLEKLEKPSSTTSEDNLNPFSSDTNVLSLCSSDCGTASQVSSDFESPMKRQKTTNHQPLPTIHVTWGKSQKATINLATVWEKDPKSFRSILDHGCIGFFKNISDLSKFKDAVKENNGLLPRLPSDKNPFENDFYIKAEFSSKRYVIYPNKMNDEDLNKCFNLGCKKIFTKYPRMIKIFHKQGSLTY